MKKLLLAVLAVATIAGVTFTEAQAARLVFKSLQWRDGASGAGAKIDRQNLGVGINDTTETFSTEGWALPNFIASQSATVTDSLQIGWIILSHDSSAAYTPSATSATIVIEGTGVDGNDFSFSPMATTTFTDPTTTDNAWRIPLYINPTLARGATAASPGLGNIWPRMRMRIVTIGGTFSSCRVSLARFADPGHN